MRDHYQVHYQFTERHRQTSSLLWLWIVQLVHIILYKAWLHRSIDVNFRNRSLSVLAPSPCAQWWNGSKMIELEWYCNDIWVEEQRRRSAVSAVAGWITISASFLRRATCLRHMLSRRYSHVHTYRHRLTSADGYKFAHKRELWKGGPQQAWRIWGESGSAQFPITLLSANGSAVATLTIPTMVAMALRGEAELDSTRAGQRSKAGRSFPSALPHLGRPGRHTYPKFPQRYPHFLSCLLPNIIGTAGTPVSYPPPPLS